jgi:hypothetical protein
VSNIIWFDEVPAGDNTSAGDIEASGLPEDWVVGRFEKRHGCRTPGQCDKDCDCGCPYKDMSEAEMLPLIDTIAGLFPDEWLAFIVPPEEDEDPLPIHGKLVAHSSSFDDVHDAMLTVLWNQCVYVFFNGDEEAQEATL